MVGRLKIAVFCALLVALPAQGLASASMLFCGVAEGGKAAFSPAIVHGHHHAAAAREEAAAGHHQEPARDHGCVHGSARAGCMACCIGASMPPPVALAAFLPDASPAPVAIDPLPFPRLGVDSPYRPPRRILA